MVTDWSLKQRWRGGKQILIDRAASHHITLKLISPLRSHWRDTCPPDGKTSGSLQTAAVKLRFVPFLALLVDLMCLFMLWWNTSHLPGTLRGSKRKEPCRRTDLWGRALGGERSLPPASPRSVRRSQLLQLGGSRRCLSGNRLKPPDPLFPSLSSVNSGTLQGTSAPIYERHCA